MEQPDETRAERDGDGDAAPGDHHAARNPSSAPSVTNASARAPVCWSTNAPTPVRSPSSAPTAPKASAAVPTSSVTEGPWVRWPPGSRVWSCGCLSQPQGRGAKAVHQHRGGPVMLFCAVGSP